MSDKTTSLAKAFGLAGAELLQTLWHQLERENPELAAKVTFAINHGHCLQMAIEWEPAGINIRFLSVDENKLQHQIMVIPALMPATSKLD